jgi:hypothetical protein
MDFGPRFVSLGSDTTVRIIPHIGEFDEEALFAKQLSYEAPVFAWLERNAVTTYDLIIEIGANIGIYIIFLMR